MRPQPKARARRRGPVPARVSGQGVRVLVQSIAWGAGAGAVLGCGTLLVLFLQAGLTDGFGSDLETLPALLLYLVIAALIGACYGIVTGVIAGVAASLTPGEGWSRRIAVSVTLLALGLVSVGWLYAEPSAVEFFTQPMMILPVLMAVIGWVVAPRLGRQRRSTDRG